MQLSDKQTKNIEKLSLEEKETFLKILREDPNISFKNAKKKLKKIKKDYSSILISDVKFNLIHSDFRDMGDDFVDKFGQADYVITDPPYPKEYVSVYSELSLFSNKILKEGGSLICMSGQSYLPEIMNRLSEHLTYQWALAYLTPGGQAAQIWPRKINTFWKPLLWFVKGKYNGDWAGDVCKSPVNNNDKRFHFWGQSANGMTDIVNKLTCPNDMIVDPFLGGGTTGIVCLKLRRNFVGIDIKKECVDVSRKRFDDFIANETQNVTNQNQNESIRNTFEDF